MEHRLFDSDPWQEVVAKLGGDGALAASAKRHKAFVRARAVASASDLLRLALIYGPGGHSLRGAAALAGAAGIADISDVALMNRIAGAAGWLKALCEERIAAIAPAQGPGLAMRIADASVIGGWRLHAAYDPAAGRICDLLLTGSRQAESLGHLKRKAGELVVADRGYPKLKDLAALFAAGADALVRIATGSLSLTGEDGKKLDWMALFDRARSQGPIDIQAKAGSSKGKGPGPLALRIVIIPKPEAAAAAAAKKIARRNSKNQHASFKLVTRAAANHLILATTLPKERFGAEALRAIYAFRWQIELAFKRMKSILNIKALPAHNPDLAQAWLYAHLLIALVIDDIRSDTGAFPPEAPKQRQSSIWRVTAFLAAILLAATLARIRLSIAIAALPQINRILREPNRKRKLQSEAIPCLS